MKMIVEFLDKLAAPGIETRIEFDHRTLRGNMIIHAHHKNKQAQFELHPDMDDDTFVCGVSKALAAFDAAPVPAAVKKRYESPRAEVFGPTPWIVAASNRIEDVSRAIERKIEEIRSCAMNTREKQYAFRQLAAWAKELELGTKLVLEMIKEELENENN
jgi:hypothetical protein